MLVAAAMGVAGAADSPQRTAAAAARKVVKIYGAGGVRGLEAYQSGILVSPDGQIVTVMSTVLDATRSTACSTTAAGFVATLIGVDPRRELAVLSIDADDLPGVRARGGEPVSGGHADPRALEPRSASPSATSGSACSTA